MLDQYYRILGVSPDAGPAEVRSAYRRRVRDWHPDRHAGDPHLRFLAEETLKDVNLAYRQIMSHLSRARQPCQKAGPSADLCADTAPLPLAARCQRLLQRIRAGLQAVWHRWAPPAGRAGPPPDAPPAGPRAPGGPCAASFDRVLDAVAENQGLRFSSTGPSRKKPLRPGVSRQPAAADRHRDSGPVSPVDPVGPIAPTRRKR